MGIIVTILSGSDENHWLDMEIPSNVPIRDLTLLIVDVLGIEQSVEDQVAYRVEHKLEGRWRRLDENQSFNDLDVEDGAYLRIQKIWTTVPSITPTNDWRPIFLDSEVTEDEETNEPTPKYAWKLLE